MTLEDALSHFKDGRPGPQTAHTFEAERIAIAACDQIGPPYFFGKAWHENGAVLFNIGKRCSDGGAWYSIFGLTPDKAAEPDVVDQLTTWITQAMEALN